MGQPRATVSAMPTRMAPAKKAYARRRASRSLMRPLRMAWLARGEVMVSMPRRTSKTSLTTFVPAWSRTAPTSASRRSGRSKTPFTQARAPAARTGMVEAVNENGRRISQVAPSRRRVRDRAPSSRSSARLVETGVGRASTPAAAATGERLSPYSLAAARSSEICALLLDDRLEERQLEAGLVLEACGAGGDILARATEHEGVEELVGDELAGLVELLGTPGGGDAVAKLEREAGAAQRDVAQDRHHVDDERFALGAIEGFAPGLVDERQQVAGGLDRARIAVGLPWPPPRGARGCRATRGSTRPVGRGSRPPSARPGQRTRVR